MSHAWTTLKIRTAAGVIATVSIVAVLGGGLTGADGAQASPTCGSSKGPGGQYDASLIGTSRGDCLRGGVRGDRINGLGGRDLLDGGHGDDRIKARDGVRDVIHCGPGRDRVRADARDLVKSCELGGHNGTDAGEETDSAPAEDSGSAISPPTVEVAPPPVEVAPPPVEVAPPPVEVDPPSTDCAVELATISAPTCDLVKSDTGEVADPEQLWGSLSCVADDRVQRVAGGGDQHATALGTPAAEDLFRRITVLDGDDYYGERCELGKNEHRYGTASPNGTFMTYQEGQRRITFLSVRIPESFPLGTSDWQTIAQMKQAQPANNGGGTPILELQLRQGEFVLDSPTRAYWSTDAQPGSWTRIALDVTYSQNPVLGSVRMYVDANGDGDATDAGEQSPEIRTATLKPETAGGTEDGIAPGESIPSHLRTGVYHNPAIPCPGGCSIDVDNVEVVR